MTAETRQSFAFRARSDAWAFMRACNDAGIQAGYPNLEGARYRVATIAPADGPDAAELADYHNVQPAVADPNEVATLRLVGRGTLTITRADYGKLGARRCDRDGARTELYDSYGLTVAVVYGTIEHIENAFCAPA